MDLINYSTAFATIVGLLMNFQSSRDSVNTQDFLNWMSESNHNDLVKLIESNKELHQALNNLLSQNHNDISEKLNALNNNIICIAQIIEGLQPIANVFNTNHEISEQAIDILRQFVNSKSKKMHYMKNTSREGGDYYILEGGAGNIKYDEILFIDDDINTLVKLGLIEKNYTSRNNPVYYITRKAITFMKNIDG